MTFSLYINSFLIATIKPVITILQYMDKSRVQDTNKSESEEAFERLNGHDQLVDIIDVNQTDMAC